MTLKNYDFMFESEEIINYPKTYPNYGVSLFNYYEYKFLDPMSEMPYADNIIQYSEIRGK